MDTPYFKFPAFEGPLDLLLHLVQKHKIDLTDIPIAVITEQYLSYIEKMAEMNVEVTADFLSMASHLLYIKSLALLPKTDKENELDPKEELEECLRLYKAAKEAAGQLEKIQFSTIDNYFKQPEKLPNAPINNDIIPLDKLLHAFKLLSERYEEKTPPKASAFSSVVRVKRVSLSEEISRVSSVMKKGVRRHFSYLFEGVYTKDAQIATFLAILHLVSRGCIYIEERGDEIYLYGGGKDEK